MFKKSLFISILLGLSACQQPNISENKENTAASQIQNKSNISNQIAIQTADGLVNLPKNPTKIAVYDYAVLDSVMALGVIPEIAPKENLVPYLQTDFQKIPHQTGTIFEPDLEQIHATRPDVIFIGSGSPKTQAELAQIAATVNMGAFGGNLIADGLSRLVELGKLFNQENQAIKLKQETEQLLNETRQIIQQKSPQKALVVMVNGGKLMIFGEKSYFGWLYHELGAPIANLSKTNLLLDNHGVSASFELIHKINPDLIFVIDRSGAVGEKSQSAQSVMDNPLVHQTLAWQNKQIVYLSGAAFTAGGGVRQIQNDLNTIKQSLTQ